MPTFLKSKWVIGAVVLIVIGVGGYFLFFHKSPTYQFVTVERGSISESVSVTGNTTPAKSVSLSFGSSGIISHTYFGLGKQVQAGQVLADLNMNDLIAGLHLAEANVSQQQARLQGLQSGARSEDVALYKQKYTDASSALIIAMQNAYLESESAVLRYVDTLFTNGTSANPIIKIRTQSQNEEQSIEMDRIIVGEKLAKWKTILADLDASSSPDDKKINDARIVGRDAVVFFTSFIDRLGTITGNLDSNSSGLSQADIDTNRATINTSAQMVSAGASAEQSAYAVWTSASGTLASQQSGSKPEDISAQVAAVKAAQASVESAQAKIQNAQIVAPISGTITQFDAKVGQLASPATPLASIMSNTGYEVDAGVSETDVGKILVGNKVTMTLDAFQNETFPGSVFYIAPAETNVQGVVSYQVKISFDKPDPRLKSGLTANIDIQTRTKDGVLVLPQYAILQNDSGTFVETLENNVVKQNPVTLGLADQKGNVEVISGVTEGQQVLNIGLKATP
jgi:HlyD family secretion protein